MGITPGSSQGMGIGSINNIPGTGQNTSADLIIGFAKGIAASVEKKKEQEAANQRAVLQSLIQQEMVSPAQGGGSKPDFNALGFGWNYNQGINDYKNQKRASDIANDQSLIAQRALEAQIKTDPGEWVQKQLDSFEKQNTILKATDPVGYQKQYEDFAKQMKDVASSGQISYLRPFPSTPQASSQPVTTPTSAEAPAQSQSPWWGGMASSAVSAVLSAFAPVAVQPSTGTATAPLTPPKQKLNPNTNQIEIWYKVRKKGTTQEGFVTQEELAVDPTLERV